MAPDDEANGASRAARSDAPSTAMAPLPLLNDHAGREADRAAEDIRIIEDSGLFDPDWYRSAYKDVGSTAMEPIEHFVRIGAAMLRNPSERFDTRFYLSANPELVDAGVNPLVHYIVTGAAEGRAALGQATQLSKTLPLAVPEPGTPAEHEADGKVQNYVVFIAGEPVEKPGYIYRVARYAEALRKLGERALRIPRQKIREHMSEIRTAKLLIIWRAAWGQDIADVIATARKAGIAVIFDVDDLMVRPELATAEIIDAIRYDNKDPARVAKLYADVRKTMAACDFCTATTHELAWHMRRHGKRRPTFVLPNGYGSDTYGLSRIHARLKTAFDDHIVRIGYAGGSRTHQADFKLCADAVAETLRAYPQARLVLFANGTKSMLDTAEFPALAGLEDRIEWRAFVPHDRLPEEMARFDINLAPLEIANPFVEAKSELKFFEAAICDVPTIASPTGPYRRAMIHGETGFLASSPAEWSAALEALVRDQALRRRVGREAHRRALWPFGPTRRVESMQSLLDQVAGDRRGSRSFYFEAVESERNIPPVPLAAHKIIYESDMFRSSRVTIIVPLYNYETYIAETLDSVRDQTLEDLDLIVVDDCSSDQSQSIARDWMETNKERFNRVLLVQHIENQGLGASRNTAIDLADTLYVMALDADNRLRPTCCAKCLERIESTGSAFAYPTIQRFGDDNRLMGERDFFPADFIPGNGIDAMAMISKEAWALVGGYAIHRLGWQDFDFWCRVVSRGLPGVHVDEILAEYRVHQSSMLRTATDKAKNKLILLDLMEQYHPWLSLTSIERHGHRATPREA